MNDYNGWTNRETWLINVWFGDAWESVGDVEITEEYCDQELAKLPLWIQDFIDFQIINWRELKEHVQASIDEEAEVN